MGGDSTKLTGPDLSIGVEEQAVTADKPLLGHAQGVPVIVVRNGDDISAVGATCTHYSTSLAGGLVVNGTIRCPAHHACFNLRTGAVEGAPALEPIPCYAVERAGGRIRVGERLPTPTARERRSEDVREIVIVGTGAAGHSAAENLRRLGFDGRITMVSRDPDLPYDRPNLSKDYLAGTAPEEWMPLRPASFYAEKRIDVMVGTGVDALDVGRRQVTLGGGRTLGYDRLLLATGADPIALPIPGADDPRVHVLRTFADCRRLVAAVTGARRVVIIGSGFIGLEAAAALRARKLEVAIVSIDREPLIRVFGLHSGVGAFLRRVHEENGVSFHLETGVKSIGPAGVEISDGTRLAADLVLVAVGVRPSTALAESAGLTVDRDARGNARGITVDAYLETSAPGVFAAGDVASYPEPRFGNLVRIEHWVVAQRMGATAAANMLGEKRRFTEVPFFWTVQYDVQLSLTGHLDGSQEVTEEPTIDGRLEDRNCRITYRRNGKEVAVLTVGRDRQSLEAERRLQEIQHGANA